MTQWKIFNKGLLSLSITAATHHHKADMKQPSIYLKQILINTNSSHYVFMHH